ncbi:polycomb group protein FIE1 [Oryza glaberrima]|uniref:Polycomb group protein FIE1 n=1 Tax=Oryza glaberrima TaxID=4538 RepID=I1QFH1_ORYGL|nr:polycomb group protein FIE1 [Oryza glaberrima]
MGPTSRNQKSSQKDAAPNEAKPPRYPQRNRSITASASASAFASPAVANSRVAKERPSSSTAGEGEPQETVLKLPSIPTLPAWMAKLVPLEGLGCEAAVGSLTPSREREYKVTNKHTEGRRPIYAIVFNFLDVRYYDIFATACGPRLSTYCCLMNGKFALLQSYLDDDMNESFFTVSWACDIDGNPLLVAAGSTGIIRVINCATEKIYKSLVGHGGSVNEIKSQPLNPSLIISASKDESIKLWNVQTGILILVFGGVGGHRHEVLGVDFHTSDIYRFLSCGMDNTVRIWSMKEFWEYVEKSYSWTDATSKFPTKFVQFPVLCAEIHSNYVDCTKWLGDFVLSKSVENEILLWEPITKEENPGEGHIDVLQKYPVPECNIWFMKFSCDFHHNQLAIGNRDGKVYVWKVQTSPPVLIARLNNPQVKSAIRQTAVSFDGSTILACTEDGNIWRWDEVDHPTAPVPSKKQK